MAKNRSSAGGSVRLTLRMRGSRVQLVKAMRVSARRKRRSADVSSSEPHLELVSGNDSLRVAIPVRPTWKEAFDEGGVITRVERSPAQIVDIVVPVSALDGEIRIHPGKVAGGGPLGLAGAQLLAAPATPLSLGATVARPISVTPLPYPNPSARPLNLIFLPDGFKAGEMAAYHAAVDAFLSKIASTAPFAALLSAIAPVRIDIASPASGIDDPAAGKYVDTLFGARFGEGELRRRIEVDQDAASRVARRETGVKKNYAAIVVANTEEYGGSGGEVSVFSRHPAAADIALHELGHSLFGLADEYSHDGPKGPPREPNVTAKPDKASSSWGARDLAKLKWKNLVTAGLAVPTHLNPDCSKPSEAPALVGVGLFEGAKYEHCGLFRPSATCKMRELTADFCPVCQGAIRAKLSAHL